MAKKIYKPNFFRKLIDMLLFDERIQKTKEYSKLKEDIICFNKHEKIKLYIIISISYLLMLFFTWICLPRIDFLIFVVTFFLFIPILLLITPCFFYIGNNMDEIKKKYKIIAYSHKYYPSIYYVILMLSALLCSFLLFGLIYKK